MSFVPSAELLRDIALCAACTQDGPRTGRAGLCDGHRARWNLEACMAQASDGAEQASLQRLAHGRVVVSRRWRAALVGVRSPAARLRMVMEAHARGAVRLPDSIADTVEKACSSGPRFLTGGQRSAAQPASPRLAERMRS